MASHFAGPKAVKKIPEKTNFSRKSLAKPLLFSDYAYLMGRGQPVQAFHEYPPSQSYSHGMISKLKGCFWFHCLTPQLRA